MLLESDAVVDHGKAPAGEIGRADERAVHILSWLGGGEGTSARRRHLLSETIDLRTFEIGDQIFRRTDASVIQPDRVTLIDQALSAPLHRLADFPTEASIGKLGTVGRGQLAVEPGRPVAADLPFKVESREDTNPETVATLAQVVALAALDDILRHAPMVRVDAVDMTGPAQHLQPANMKADEASGSLPCCSKLSRMRSRCRPGW